MKKKYILIAAIIAVSSTAFAQVKFGPQVSAGLATVSLKEEPGVKYEKSAVPAFAVGVGAEITLTEKLSLRPSLSLFQKGGKIKGHAADDGGIGSVDFNVKNTLYYAELPVLATYNVNLAGSKIFFGAGPSLGVGLFGKSKGTFTINFPGLPPMTETDNADAFKKEEDEGANFDRIDFSANAVAGIQWTSGLYVNLGYLHGFTNLQKESDGGWYKNRSFQVSVGFLLGGK